MTAKHVRVSATCALCFLSGARTIPVAAQNDGNAGIVLELPANTRALALGNAFMLSGNDPDAIFYHPALVRRASGSSFSIQRYSTTATLLTASSAIDGFGIGVQALSYGAIGPNLLTNPIGVRDITSDNPIASSELVATVGYARDLLGFQVGIAGKWIQQRIGAAHATTVAGDVGVAREIGFLHFGVAAQHMGSKITIGSTDLPLPLRFGLGVSTDVEQVGPVDVAASTALFRQHDGGIMAGGGLEIAFWPIVGRTFTGRIGGLHEPHTGTFYVTFGGAITLDNVTGNYAFQGVSSPGSGHRAAIRWR